ncbi:hypothetical protein Y032_0062g3397 [Ancylostoma ceylanicum]|uniref:Uncharacterized protein n=1 Tax=Ancylostoma ceylanicum TaxID=53326 RepID=A0A016U3J4_9BILA|nr:hypothetical protein Y032_0062g3397 [Ancylostoma ceylanicum]
MGVYKFALGILSDASGPRSTYYQSRFGANMKKINPEYLSVEICAHIEYMTQFASYVSVSSVNMIRKRSFEEKVVYASAVGLLSQLLLTYTYSPSQKDGRIARLHHRDGA